jgi:acetyltransferase
VHVGPDRPGLFADVAALIAEAPEVGGVLAVHAPTGTADDATIAALASAARSLRVPLLAAVPGESTARRQRQKLTEAGLPVFASPEQAARGFRHLVQNRRNRLAAAELPPSTVLAIAPDRYDVRRQIDRARAAGQTELSEEIALSILGGYGLPTVPTRPVASPEDAMAAAELLGFPVVLKLRREQGRLPGQRAGIVLDVSNPEETRRVAQALLRRARMDQPPLAPLFVQRRVGRTRELRVRVWVDAMFGPVIGFGQGGGASATALGDMAVDLPPLNLPLAQGLVARSKAMTVLAGRPDLAAANLQAVAECLVRLSQLIVDFPELAAMEVNPIFADSEGILVADAAITLHPIGAEIPQLAISPYPVELVEQWSTNGEAVTVRPIRPEDAEQHGAFFNRLSAEDIRYRFFSAVRMLSPEQVARLTQVDYDREMAFIALREATGETIGVSRLVLDVARRSGEFAVIVQPDMKGRGLASHLMRRLIDWGRSRGLAEIIGQVLADNAPMLAFVRHLGFSIRRLPEEPDVVEARLVLDANAA